ncbi:MAG: glycosyltransferase family 4 protein [Planctomycetota bacterium]
MPDQPPKSNQPGQPAITALDVPTPEPLEPRRVLFFGKRKSRTRCTGALVEALRAQGLQVRTVNCSMLKRWIGTWGMRAAVRLVRRLYDPDLCFVFFHDLPPDLMEEISGEIPTVVWMEEQLRHTDSSHVDYVRKVRLLCLSTPDLVEAYRRAGVRDTTFSMSGFSPRYHRPLRAPRAQVRDLCFIGGPGHMGDRPQFLAWLSRMHDVEVFGRRDSWLPYLKRFPELRLVGEVRPRRYARVCAETRIVLGQNQTHDSPLYFSNRLFLTLASGGFHLTHYVPGMEELFDRGAASTGSRAARRPSRRSATTSPAPSCARASRARAASSCTRSTATRTASARSSRSCASSAPRTARSTPCARSPRSCSSRCRPCSRGVPPCARSRAASAIEAAPRPLRAALVGRRTPARGPRAPPRRRRLGPVLVLRPGARFADLGRELGLPVRELPLRNGLDVGSAVRLRRLCRAEAPDLVQLGCSRSHKVWGLARLLGGGLPPAVVTRRMDYPLRRGRYRRWLYGRAVDAVVAVSEAVAREVRRWASSLASRSCPTASTRPSSSLAPRRAEARSELGVPDDAVLGVTLASLHRRKGLDVLLEALARVAVPEGRGLTWILAGEGPELEDLRRRAGRARPQVDVRIPGRRMPAETLLAAADLFCLPSRREGLGVALLEAMAAGLPCVASRVGGMLEAIEDRVSGLHVDVDDVGALAGALGELVADEGLRARLGVAARARVAERHDIGRMCRDSEALYRRVVVRAAEQGTGGRRSG